MPILNSVSVKVPLLPDGFPFNIPAVSTLRTLNFNTPVTFFVGENGSGKSTLLEGIAAGFSAVTVGGDDIAVDESLSHARKLSDCLRFSWSVKTGRGFFSRAEDFYNFSRRINKTSQELEELAAGFEAQLKERPGDPGLMRAMGSMRGQRAALRRKYGENLDWMSHGESFLKVFQARIVPQGLYLLDEPETPLSPLRQLALLGLIKEAVAGGGQFIIATHSPIIMAWPGATIYSFDQQPVSEIAYEDTQHVKLTRAFMNNAEAFLRRL